MNRLTLLALCLLALTACDRTKPSGSTTTTGDIDREYREKQAREDEENRQKNIQRLVGSWRIGEGEKLYHGFAAGYDLKTDGTFVAVPDPNAGEGQKAGSGAWEVTTGRKNAGRMVLKGDGAPAVAEFHFDIDREDLLFIRLPNPAKDPTGVSILYRRQKATGK
jgi:hypothetical protein